MPRRDLLTDGLFPHTTWLGEDVKKYIYTLGKRAEWISRHTRWERGGYSIHHPPPRVHQLTATDFSHGRCSLITMSSRVGPSKEEKQWSMFYFFSLLSVVFFSPLLLEASPWELRVGAADGLLNASCVSSRDGIRQKERNKKRKRNLCVGL